MPLLVNSVPNLAQGVSQQPDNLRFPGQCDEQINAWATVVEGLVKRPNTNFVSKVSTDDGAGLFTHFVKQSEQNKYCVAVSLGGVGVINLADGTNVPVAVTSIANTYLSLGGQASLGAVANPLTDLRALTVADYTFLVNRNRTIQKSEAAEQKSTPPPDEALIVVKLGDYEKAYSIYVDDKLVPTATALNSHHDYSTTNGAKPATYISGPSTATAHLAAPGLHADTEFIADDLYDCINQNVVNTNSGVSSITINPTYSALGDGWLGGRSTGVYEKSRYTGATNYGSEYRKELKLEVFITQSGAAEAHAELVVTKGVITSARNIKRGSNFNPSNPVAISYRVYERNWRWDWMKGGNRWEGWNQITDQTHPHYYIPPATFNSSTNASTDPVQVTTVSFTNGGFEATLNGSVIKLTSTEGPFNIRVEDGLGGQALGVVYREVNSITELPVKCYNGFGPVKVIGDADIDQDDYYVRFSTKDKGEFGEGSWIETVGYFQDESQTSALEGIDTLLASGTMPVTLVPYFNGNTITDFRLSSPNALLYVENDNNYYRLDKNHRATAANEPGTGADWEEYWTEVDETVDTGASVGYLVWREGTFYYGTNNEYRFGSWSARSAGDDNTNPFPSFVGRTIRDIFFFKNRLGILTDSNVIFSEADEYYNFFRTTTQQLLDSAPIDIGLSHTKVAVLQYAKAFQEKLMLFSDNSQFVLRGADVLSPKTVAISPVSEYDTTDNVEPLVLGNYIYFPFNRDKYIGMYEYFVDNNTEVFEAQEITEHVPKYIPSLSTEFNIRMMAGSTTQNALLLQPYADQNSLFVYKYFWSGKEKIQSAWQKFTFNGGVIRGFDFVDSTLYLLVNRGGGLYLEKLVLEEGYVDKEDGASLGEYFAWDSAYPILLDCNTSYFEGVTHQYDAVNNVTTLSNIPFTLSSFDVESDIIQVWSKYGSKYSFTRVNDSTLTINGPLYDYVTYNGTIYKCNLSHDSGWRDKGSSLADNFKPDGSLGSTTWSTLTGDEAARVTTAPEWQQDVWYEGYENFVIGFRYDMLYKFSDQTLKQPTERGGRSASNYTYQTLRTGSLNYADTGFFQVEVTPKHRDKYSYAFNPDIVGANLTLNKFTPQDGHFKFPIQAQPGQVDIKITSNSALPVKLLGAEFESMFIPRSRRYGA